MVRNLKHQMYTPPITDDVLVRVSCCNQTIYPDRRCTIYHRRYHIRSMLLPIADITPSKDSIGSQGRSCRFAPASIGGRQLPIDRWGISPGPTSAVCQDRTVFLDEFNCLMNSLAVTVSIMSALPFLKRNERVGSSPHLCLD